MFTGFGSIGEILDHYNAVLKDFLPEVDGDFHDVSRGELNICCLVARLMDCVARRLVNNWVAVVATSAAA